MLVIRNAGQIVRIAQARETAKRGADMRDLAILNDGALILRDEVIEWIGPTAQLPPVPAGTAVLDATAKVVIPGLVDSHTHLIFAGTRENEFEQRLEGATYQQIAARG